MEAEEKMTVIPYARHWLLLLIAKGGRLTFYGMSLRRKAMDRLVESGLAVASESPGEDFLGQPTTLWTYTVTLKGVALAESIISERDGESGNGPSRERR